MSTEKVAVTIPGKGSFVVDVTCKPSDGDDEIALRMASGFPPGSIFSISGVKWQSTSKAPPKVIELKPGEAVQRFPREVVLEAAREPVKRPEGLPPSEPHKVSKPKQSFEEMAKEIGPLPTTVLASLTPPIEPGTYAPGQQWRPKDPRRKSGFTIKAVTRTEVIADDGRTIQLERMKRYERVG